VPRTIEDHPQNVSTGDTRINIDYFLYYHCCFRPFTTVLDALLMPLLC